MPKRGWEIKAQEATPEHVYYNRRRFLKAAGFSGLTAVGLLLGCGHKRVFEPFDQGTDPDGGQTGDAGGSTGNEPPARSLYPADQNPAFATLDRPLTDESVAGSYNNFYEFSTGKANIAKLAEQFVTDPWKVTVSGRVANPKTYDFSDLLTRMPLEERLYRHRCVEAWSMAVPWTGFPMRKLIDEVAPTGDARYVKMTTFLDPKTAPGQWGSPQWPWPYVEGLTMAEALNELTFLVTGIYGHELPKQHGAPIRLATPWKYGFKSIKSIVSIEFTVEQPATFWNSLVPQEYTFQANVNPAVPHPRWSQATERVIGTSEQRPTLPYNGYGDYVADLYA